MTAGVSLPDASTSLADRRAFSCNGVTFTVADLARRAQVGDRAASPLVSSASAAEEAFRRSRGLLTADRLEAWLASWEIDPEDFRRWTSDAASGTSTATAWCALLCSGGFDAITAEVAAAAAAASELGAGPSIAAGFDPDGWVERLVVARTTTEGLTAAIAAHRLDWTRLATVVAVTPRRGVAEELRHQVLADGTDLGRAAAAADCPVQEIDDVLAAFTPGEVRAALAGALAGDLVGPVPAGAAWTVLSVLDRTEPALEDPPTRARAEAVVRHDVIARAVAQHVVA